MIDISLIRELWIPVLLSGEYEQGQHALRVEEEGKPKYCCLGVLCDVHPDVEWQSIFSYMLASYKESESDVLLPRMLAEDLGFDAVSYIPLPYAYNSSEAVKELGDVTSTVVAKYVYKYGISLTGMNDCGATFEEIATVLELVCQLWETENE